MFAPLFLLLTSLPQADADLFREGLSEVRRLGDEERWEAARDALDALLEEHRERDYVLRLLPEIREEARRSARKVRWKKVVKRFERHLRDLIQREYPDREVEDLDPIDEIEPAESA